MNKKIYALLLLVFVLVTLSAVSAADVQDNNQTLALDSSSDMVAVSNEDSNALKLSNDDEIQQISDSEDDVLGAGSGISITSCPSTMDYGNPYEKLNFEIFAVGPDGSNYGEIPDATVWLNVDGERIVSTTSSEDGYGSLSLSSLPSGTHIVKCEYDGSDYYDASASATRTITVNGGDTPSEKTTVYLENYDGVPSITMNYGDSKTYTAAVYSDDQYSHPLSGVPLKLTAGSNIVRATSNANGEATFDLSTITPGTYTATIDVDSDDYEADSTFTIGLTVNGDAPEKTTVYLYDNAHPSSMTEGDSESLSVMVENGDTGAYQDGVTLKVTIDKDYSITTANAGIASLDLSEVPAGTYTVRIVVNDANYESSGVITYDLTVNEKPKVSVHLSDYTATESIVMTEGDARTYTVTVEDANYDDVVVGVRVKLTAGDNVVYATSDSNGEAAFDLSGVSAGSYPNAVAVVDDSNYKSSDSLPLDLTVNEKAKVSVHLSDYSATASIVMTEGDARTYTVTVEDANYDDVVVGVRVKLTAGDNVVYATSDSNGEAAFDLSGVSAGSYPNAVAVVDDSNYKSSDSLPLDLTVNKDSSKTTLKIVNINQITSITMNEGESPVCGFELYDAETNPIDGVNVKLTAGNTKLTATTSDGGYFCFDLSTVPANTYAASVVVDDENYTSNTVTFTLTVNGKMEVDLANVYPDSNAIVTIFEDGSVIVSFKVIDMTHGDPIEGINVQLTVNETTYNNVSASGGITSFTLSGFPLGSYDCVAIVNDSGVIYDSVYCNIPFVLKVISKDLTYTPEDSSIDNIKIPYGGNMDWNVVDSADNAINGEVKITSGDFSTTANITDGKFNSDLKGLDAGSHEVTFSVENYNDKVFNIEIVPADTVTVLTIPKTSVIDGTVEFKAKVNATTGKITFYLDNLELTSKDVDENGEASYPFTISTLGSIKISANYTDSNGNYNPSNDSGVIDVTKKPYQIYGDQVIYYGEKFDRIVNDGGMITGDFTLKNDTFETTLHADSGILTFDLSKVDVGTYTFNLTSEKYEDKEITITINPVASKTTLTGHTNINVGDDQSLTVQVNVTSGQVAFYVNDVLNQTVDLNGENTTTFDLSSLPAGNYTISANYSNPKGNYKESSASMKVTVSLIDASVSAEDITLNVGENKTIEVNTAPEGLEVTYTPDNSGVVTVEDGVVTGVKEGSANVTITIVGDGKYYENSTTITVTVNKIGTKITVANETVSLKVEEEIDSGVSLDPIDAGTLNYTSSNSSVVKVEDGKLVAVGEGTATVTVSFDGDDKYNAAESKTIDVTVSLYDASVSAEDITLNVGENETIAVTTTPEGLNVTYTPDNSGVVTVDDNGVVTGIKGGSANVTITIVGDGKYYENSTTITVTVNKLDTTISVSDKVEMNVGDSVNLNATLTPADAGNLTYYSLSPSFVKIDQNGTIVAISEGNASVAVAFNGNEKYNSVNTKVITVTVKKIDTSISVNDRIDMNVDDIVNANATLTPADAGNLTYKSDTESVVKVEDGKLVAVAVGDATVTVSFDGNEKYNKAESKTIRVTVHLIDASVSAEDITLDVGANATINTTTTPEGLEVIYTPDNSGVVEVDENGVVTGLKEGSADVTITIVGNGKYYENSTTITVTVKKIDTSIDVESKSLELYVDDEGHIVATLNPDGGDVNFTSSDESIITVDNFGDFRAVAEGTATITVSFAGDDKYNAAEDVTVTVKVSKIDTFIEFNYDPINLKVHNETMVIATLKPAEAGNVTYTSSNESVVTVDNEGNVVAVGAGSATITASFAGNDKYNEAENVTVNVTVSKIDTKITVNTDSLDLKVGNETTVKGTLTPSGAGKVSYMSNNDSVVTVDENTGKVTAVSEGTATIIVYYDGNDDYNMADDVTISVTVSKIDTSIEVNKKSLDLKVGKDSTVTAKLTPADAGAITFTSSDESVVTVDKNGKVKAVSEGSATITASYAGSDKYNAAKDVTVDVTVSLNDAKVTAKDITLNVGDNDTIAAVTTPKGLEVIYTPDNSGVVTVDEDGVVTAVKAGTAKITLTVGGDGQYAKNSTTVTVTVKKIDTSIEVDEKSLDLKVGDDSSVAAKLSPADAGNVVFTSSDESVVTVDKDGKVTAVGAGSATVTASYAGSDKYNSAENVTVAVSVKENKQNASMDVDADKAVEDENSTITVNLPKDATGNVTAVIEGNPYTAPVVNGTATIAVPGLRPGNYTAHVTYSGDDKYKPASKDINYEVEEVDKSDIISAPDVTKYFGGSERFVVNITDYEGNPVANKSVTIEINGQSYGRTTKADGTTSIGLALNSGVFNVTVTVGNETLNAVVTVLPTVNGTDVVKVYRNATPYYATFRDSEGNYLKEGTTVTFNINGVMYERKISGSEGLAKLNLNLEQGTYVLTAMNPQTGENAANNITIIPRLVENKDITKYYRNATQYTVKVLGDDGNPVGAGETVTFNINGVMYNRQTNESGIAKLNLNLQPDDYIITAEYKNCKVSNKIKILPVLSAKDISMKYRDGTKFVATLVDGQGKPFAGQTIQFNINGVFYNRVTDSSGQAKLNINLQAGQYIITSSYNGANLANTVTIAT